MNQPPVPRLYRNRRKTTFVVDYGVSEATISTPGAEVEPKTGNRNAEAEVPAVEGGDKGGEGDHNENRGNEEVPGSGK